MFRGFSLSKVASKGGVGGSGGEPAYKEIVSQKIICNDLQVHTQNTLSSAGLNETKMKVNG